MNKAVVFNFIYLDALNVCHLLKVKNLNTSHMAKYMLFDVCIIIYDGK